MVHIETQKVKVLRANQKNAKKLYNKPRPLFCRLPLEQTSFGVESKATPLCVWAVGLHQCFHIGLRELRDVQGL